jgi:hypothetical protein
MFTVSYGSRIAVIILSLGVVAGAAGLANAETWNQAHPRRAEVNARLNNQNHRINEERREGEITAGQARALHAQDRFIRREERFEAKQNGVTSPAPNSARSISRRTPSAARSAADKVLHL